jgi:serine/threonine protein kinase
VAIKILAPHLTHQPRARERFAREARAVAAISHDNVLSIFSVSEASGLPYLVMPYVSGRSLAEKLEREGRLPMTQVLRIGIQTALGLAAAHAAGVVHRDVKPSNLLLEGDEERVRIADFGLASILDDGHLTQTGTIPGTPEFMAPEQAREEPIDARVDLFSLGTVLYLMSTGQSPFRAATPLASLRRVCDDQPRSVSDLNPEASAWFAAIVERLLQKSPTDRYQTAAEVAESLQHHLAGWGQPQRPAPRPADVVEAGPSSPDRAIVDGPGQYPLAAVPPQSSTPNVLISDQPHGKHRTGSWFIATGLLLAALITPAVWTIRQWAMAPTSVAVASLSSAKQTTKGHNLPAKKAASSNGSESIAKNQFSIDPTVAGASQTFALKVRGKSDPFLAGMPNGATASGGDKAPAESPVLVSGLSILGGTILTFSASGATKYDTHAHMNGPDGGITMVWHSKGEQHGIANLRAPIDSLVGVFLGPDPPNRIAAPPSLDFSSGGNVPGGVDFETLKPALQQVFFIGDGKTAAGVLQRIIAPAGATRLALGTWDRYGWSNNGGSLEVTVSANMPASNTPAATDAEEPKNKGASTGSSLDVARRTR